MRLLEAMEEALRLVDYYQCNSNKDEDCEIYPVEMPGPTDLKQLALNYILQLPLLYLVAGAGFTGRDEFTSYSYSLLTSLAEVNVVLYLIPGIVLLGSSFFNLIPDIAIWMIQFGPNYVGWMTYVVGVFLMSLGVVLDRSQVNVRMLLTYVPLVLLSLWHQI